MTWKVKASFAAGQRISVQTVAIDGLSLSDSLAVARGAAMAELDALEVTLIRSVLARLPQRRNPTTTGVSHV